MHNARTRRELKFHVPTRTARRCMAVLVALALVGCSSASLSQVKQFGAASAVLAEHTHKALDLANTATIDRNLYDVAATPGKGPTDATFQGLFAGNVGAADGSRHAQRLKDRLQVLEQLSAYSNALQLLSEADVSQEIDEASKNLNGALVGLAQTYNKASGEALPIGDADLGLIATAVNAIGKTIAERKRRAAVKTVIEQADPAIQRTTTLLAAELGRDSEIAKFVEEALSNSRGSIQQAYNFERDNPGSTFERRYAILVRAKQLYDAEEASPAFFAAVGDGAKKVGETHGALRRAVGRSNFSSSEVAKLIGELEVLARSVRDFYKSLEEVR